MAITDGLSVTCSDLQAVGGTRLIAIRAWTASDDIDFDDTNHTIDKIIDGGGSTASWGLYESRIESSSVNINATGEGKDFLTYECEVQFFLPALTATQFDRLTEMTDDCLMVMVINNNDASTSDPGTSSSFEDNLVLGVSNKFQNQGNLSRSQQYCKLVSVEGGTGSAFSDEIGVTVTIRSTQFEAPRHYVSPGCTVNSAATGMTTA